VEKGYSLNTLSSSNNGKKKEAFHMDIATYFTLLINVLMVLTFIALVLFFLYMVYRKEEETPEKPTK